MSIIKVKDQLELVPVKNYKYAKFPFENFNPVQSRVFEFFDKNCNAVIAAKTSAGKTVVSEMFAAEHLANGKGKIIYLAPMRALAKEKYDDWTDENHHFKKYKVSVCTGDYRLTPERKKEIDNSDIIVLTSEMLNSRTRNFKSENNEWLKKVSLCVIDESHLLTVPGRGDHLEVGLINFTELNPDVKFVLLSATMPNVDEIAGWVSSLNNTETYLLESEYRPCPLGIHYEKYDDLGFYKQVEENKIQIAIDIIKDNPEDKFLLFVHTKDTGRMLEASMKEVGLSSVEFHSADLDKNKREKLESRFKDKSDKGLKYLIATSTLAWGCYKSNTLVLMADNTLRYICDVKKGEYVYSWDGKNFVPAQVLNVGEKKVDEFLKFTLESGEEFFVSDNHEFYGTIERENLNYYEANKFKVGDFLTVPSLIENTKACEVIPDNKGYLFGYFIGDGSKTLIGKHKRSGKAKFSMDFAFGDHELHHLLYVKDLTEKVFGYKFKKIRPDENGVLHLRSKQEKFLDNFSFYKGGRNKQRFSLLDLKNQDLSFIKGFIQGLFDSDGGWSFHNDKNISLEYTTISPKLAKEIQQYLLFFGVRACVGKKKFKKRIINGKIQLSRRKYSYRVRIYKNQIKCFLKNIGFRNLYKDGYGKYFLENEISNREKDYIPVRKLIIDHAEKHNISVEKMMNSVKSKSWNVINVQELTRNKCKEILNLYPNESEFKNIVNSPIRFSKIKSIKKVINSVGMWDLEIDKYHNFIGNGVVSHNCNTPARRVIVLGVHRAFTEVENYDIFQMIGRSGRPGFDLRGDAYILLPRNKFTYYKNKLAIPAKIESKLLENTSGNYKTLAFHLVSEIHHGRIKNKKDVKEWYSKTLAHCQLGKLDNQIIDSALDLLLKCRAIELTEEKEYKITIIGMISSMFYYSPFDVADLRTNFKQLFNGGNKGNDLLVAMAFGNTDTNRYLIASKAEKEDMDYFKNQVKKFSSFNFTDGAYKAGFAYYCAMHGKSVPTFASTVRMLQNDFPRIIQVLNGLDNMGCKWKEGAFFKEIQSKITYGVGSHLIDFVQLPGVGKVKAERLWSLGFKNLNDIVSKPEVVSAALNLKADKVKEIVSQAKQMLLIKSV